MSSFRGSLRRGGDALPAVQATTTTAIRGASSGTRATGAAWLTATVGDVVAETARVRTIVLDVDGWSGHRAGHHLDVRLTAEDGYQAERTYSIASAPEEDVVRISVEFVEDGEVSPYLAGELAPGDAFEIRGPVGAYFTWSADEPGPLLRAATIRATSTPSASDPLEADHGRPAHRR